MILIGFLLMAACAALAVDAIVENTAVTHAVAFNQAVHGVSLGSLFVAGAVLGLLFALGLTITASGLTRSRRRRHARHVAAADEQARAEKLDADNRRLREALRQHEDSAAYPAEPASQGARTGPAEGIDVRTSGLGRHRDGG